MLAVLTSGIILFGGGAVPYVKGVNPYTLDLDTKDITDEYTVVYRSPDPETLYAYSPGIFINSSGRMFVSWDLGGSGTTTYIPRGYTEAPGWHSVGMVSYSDDGGKTYTRVLEAPFLFGRVFEADGVMYTIARDSENYRLVIYRSDDGGLTFGKANYLDSRTWHSSPTQPIYIGDYVYMTMEVLSLASAQKGYKGRAVLSPVLMKARVTDDLTQPENWHFSEELAYADLIADSYNDMDYTGVPYMKFSLANVGWLEGNVFQIYDPEHDWYDPSMKTFYIYLRGSTTGSGYAAVMKFTELEDGSMIPSAVTVPSGKSQVFIPMPGGNDKFSMSYDGVSGLYWLASNQTIDSTRGVDYMSEQRGSEPSNERTRLALYYSTNAVDWTYAGLVSHGESEREARSYCSMIIDGDDLLVFSRSGTENAHTAHDNDMVTLHRMKNFRDLAVQKPVAFGFETVTASEGGTDLKDTTLFKASDGTLLTTVSKSDGRGEVFRSEGQNIYTKVLDAEYKFGSIFEQDGILYVFGVRDRSLVLFSSQDSGSSFSGPVLIDSTRTWESPPADATIRGGKVYLSGVVLDDHFKIIRGYTDATGSLTGLQNETTLYGYGAVSYEQGVTVSEGTTLSIRISPEEVFAGSTNRFGILLSDTDGSFADNAADSGNGFLLELRSFGSNFANGFNYWYAKVGNGQSSEMTSFAGYIESYTAGDFILTFTKETKKINGILNTWRVDILSTATGLTTSKYIPATDVPENLFAGKKAYLSFGNRSGNMTTFRVSDIAVNRAAAYEFQVIRGYSSAATGALSQSGGLTLHNGYGATGLTSGFELSEGTILNFQVTPATLAENNLNQFLLGLTNKKGSFFAGTADTGDGFGIELRAKASNYRSGCDVYAVTAKKGAIKTTVLIGSIEADMTAMTVSAAFTKKNQTVDGTAYSWEINVTNTATGGKLTKLIKQSDVAEDTWSGRQGYLIAGCRSGVIAFYRVGGISLKTVGETQYVGSTDLSFSSPIILSATIGTQLTQNTAWSFSGTLPFYHLIEDCMTDPLMDYMGLPYHKVSKSQVGWTDASIVLMDDYEDARYKENSFFVYLQSQGIDTKHAGVLRVTPDQSGVLQFSAVTVPSGNSELLINLPGGNSRFDLVFDELSKLYWLATVEQTNSVISGQQAQCRIALYYSYNAYDWCYAGLVEKYVGKETAVGLSISGRTLSLTASVDNELKLYTIENFRELSEYQSLLTWSRIRGYENTTGTFSYDDDKVILNGYGALRFDQSIPVLSNTSITFKVSPKLLTQQSANNFAIALLNNNTSYFSNAKDTADGFAFELRSNSDYQTGYTLWYSPITAGQPGTFSAFGEMIAGDMTRDTITVTFTKKTTIQDGVLYSWEIAVHSKSTGKTFKRFVPAASVPDNLFADRAYLTAGTRNGKINLLELSHPTFIHMADTSDLLIHKGEQAALRLDEIFSVSGYQKPVYSSDAGEVTEGVWTVKPQTAGLKKIRLFAAVGAYVKEASFQMSVVGQMMYPIRGYSALTGEIAIQDNDIMLAGYGAAYSPFALPVKTSASISFCVLTEGLMPGINNLFGIALLNQPGSFYNGTLDRGSGLGIQLRSFIDYTKGGALYYSDIVSGEWKEPVGGTEYRVGNRSLDFDMSTTPLYITVTKVDVVAKEIRYTWRIDMQPVGTNRLFTTMIPESLVPDSQFGEYAYLSMGYRKTSGENLQSTVRVRVTNLSISAVDFTGLPIAGDLNQDGSVNVQDAILLRNVLLKKEAEQPYRGVSDADGNRKTDIADLMSLKQTALNDRKEI